MDILLETIIYWEEQKLEKHRENVNFHNNLVLKALREKKFENIRINKRNIKFIIESYPLLTDFKYTPSKFKRMEKLNEFPLILENGNPIIYKEPEFLEYFFRLINY